MVKATVTLTYDGNTYRVLCNQVTVSGKKNIDAAPYSNIGGPVEAQTLSYENLKIIIGGIHFTDEVGTLTWGLLRVLYKHTYDKNAIGDNGPIILNVNYGSSKQLSGISGLTNINVVLNSFSFPIDVTNTREGYMPIGSMILSETL